MYLNNGMDTSCGQFRTEIGLGQLSNWALGQQHHGGTPATALPSSIPGHSSVSPVGCTPSYSSVTATRRSHKRGILSTPTISHGVNREATPNSDEPQIIYSRQGLNPLAPAFTSNGIYSNDIYDGFPPLNRLI